MPWYTRKASSSITKPTTKTNKRLSNKIEGMSIPTIERVN